MVSSTILAVDAGQTGIRLRRWDDPTITEFEAPAIRSDKDVQTQVAEAILRTLSTHHLDARTIAIGLTGLVAGSERPGDILRSCIAFGTKRVVIAHDSVRSFLAALGEASGATLAIGTAWWLSLAADTDQLLEGIRRIARASS